MAGKAQGAVITQATIRVPQATFNTTLPRTTTLTTTISKETTHGASKTALVHLIPKTSVDLRDTIGYSPLLAPLPTLSRGSLRHFLPRQRKTRSTLQEEQDERSLSLIYLNPSPSISSDQRLQYVGLVRWRRGPKAQGYSQECDSRAAIAA